MKMHALRATVALAILSALSPPSLIVASESKRSWQIEDSIGNVYYEPISANGADARVSFSPDGSAFGVLRRRGESATDSRVYTLDVYSTAEVEAWLSAPQATSPPRSFRTLTRRSMSSAYAKSAIGQLQWDASSRRIYFLGLADNDSMQVYEWALGSGRVRRLTHVKIGTESSPSVAWFTAHSGALVYEAVSLFHPTFDYPSELAERGGWGGLVTELDAFPQSDRRVFFQRGARHREIANAARIGRVATSPSGRYEIFYEVADTRLSVLDLRSGERKMTDLIGEAFEGERAIWSGDERTVVIQGVRPVEKIPGRITSSIARLDLERSGVDWLERVPPDAGVTRRTSGLAVSVIEDASTAPHVVVTSSDGARRVLLPSSPKLADIWIAPQRAFTWTDETGARRTGALYLPRTDGTEVVHPLVVQAYVYDPDRFLPDGTNPTIDATQLLVAQGYAVFKYDITDLPGAVDEAGRAEGDRAGARLDSAVDALAAAGFIDRERVALTGFSRAGYQALYISTHPTRTRLVAVICADSWDGTFVAGLGDSALNGPDAYLPVDVANGGSFWRNRAEYLRHDPFFNADHIQAPILFTSNFGGLAFGNPTAADMIAYPRLGALTALRRPWEYARFPHGDHNLARPNERRAALELAIEWINFWMRGLESADTAKAQQNERWRNLRDEWRVQLAWEAAGHSVGSNPSPEFRRQ